MSEVILNNREKATTKALLRHLPNRRKVYLGELNQQLVLIKQFIGKDRDKYFSRELKGVKMLIDANIPTPKLLQEITQTDQNILIFDYLENSVSFKKCWTSSASTKTHLSSHQSSLIQLALKSLANLYQCGLYQKDLHLDNLLIDAGTIYFIDGDGILAENLGKPLSLPKQYENLALFFAQFPRPIFILIKELIADSFPELDSNKLLDQSKLAAEKRLYNFIKKLNRPSTQFDYKKNDQYLFSYSRSDFNTQIEPQNFLAATQKNLTIKPNQIGIISLGNGLSKRYIVKSYPPKEKPNFFKRARSTPSAWHDWQEGNRLRFSDIPTPKPIAVFEAKPNKQNQPSYLVYEQIGSHNILEKFADYQSKNTIPNEEETLALINLFESLISNAITHGDLKGSNIIWHQDHWKLIELSLVQQHKNKTTFLKAYSKDREQFLRNWPDQSMLRNYLDEKLPTIHHYL